MLFSGTSDLLSQLWNHFSTLPTTSHLSSTLFNDLHFCAHLLDSPQLSFDLSLLLSTPFNSRWLISPQFHLSNFFSAQSKWRSCKLSCSGLIAFRFDHGFNIRLCYHSRVMCYCWLLLTVTFRPTFKHAWAAVFFPRARRAVMSRAAICQERSWAAQPHASLSPACLKGETSKDITQAAQLCVPPECSKAWQTKAAQPCALLPCFFLLDIMSPSQSSLRKVTFPQNTIVYYSRSRSSEEPRRSHHSTAICRDWVAKHKRITNNGYTNWSSKTGSRSPRTKTTILTLKHFLNLFERNFQRKIISAKIDKNLLPKALRNFHATTTIRFRQGLAKDLQNRTPVLENEYPSRSLGAAIPLRSAQTEWQNTKELQHTTVEHIALMHQCTKYLNTCKAQ